MKRGHVAVSVVVTVAACLLVPFAGSAAGPPDVVCPQDTFTFTGTAHDLIVPEGGFCAVTDATITHDMIQRDDAGAEIVGTSIGQRPDLRGVRGSRHLEVDRRARHRRRRNRVRRRHHGFVDRARLRRTGRGVGRRHPAVDDRARHAAARPGRRHASRERDHRARLLRLEAADGADGTQRTEHARRPGEGRPRLRDRGIAPTSRSCSTASAT